MSTVQLPELPSLSKLYLSAAATAARKQVGKAASAKAGSGKDGLDKGGSGKSGPGKADPSSGGQQRKGARATLPDSRHEVSGAAVDVERLTNYQHLLHESARDLLPSGYVHALAFPVAMSVMTVDDFPLPLLGMIHLKNYVEHRRPVHFSEPLDIAAWAQNLRGHRAGTQVEMVAEVAVAGEVVWHGVSTYLAKGVYLPGLDGPHAPTPPSDFTPPLPTANWRLGPDTGRAYAAVSGDFNPIHLSAITARALGMRRSIVHGMYLASRALSNAGTDSAQGFSWEVEFAAPVFLPATVALAVDDFADREGQWESSQFTAWNPRSARKHFSGAVRRL